MGYGTGNDFPDWLQATTPWRWFSKAMPVHIPNITVLMTASILLLFINLLLWILLLLHVVVNCKQLEMMN